MQPGGQFLVAQASMHYALTALSDPKPALLPGEVIAGSGATVTGTVHMAYCYVFSGHPYSLRSQVLLFLSVMACQFYEDTGKPSLLVQDLNLIACPLA